MRELHLDANHSDDPDFLAFVEELVCGAAAVHHPVHILIFKIDHWFGHKWLTFSGKALGAVGVRNYPPTIPPFVANRIIGQQQFTFDSATSAYRTAKLVSKIHHCGHSPGNLHRYAKRIAPDSALFWYSGDTANTQRGSLMGYVPVDSEIWPWFIAFGRQDVWKICHRKSIHEFEVRSFLTAAAISKRREEMRDPTCGLRHEETWNRIENRELK